MAKTIPQMPVLFLSHGAGPCWFLDETSHPLLKGLGKTSKSASFYQNFMKEVKIPTPKALLVISAHWEETEYTVNVNTHPLLYFDYYGFPDETYQIKWPAPGAPALGKKVKELLQANGFQCLENSQRGLDHGVFVPLKLMFPKADIPVTQLSLKRNLNMEEHIKLGRALQPLRNEGVLIIGSGQTTHSGQGDGSIPPWVDSFTDYLNNTVTSESMTASERETKLLDLQRAPAYNMYKEAHPRTEHFIPLPVVMGAAGFVPGRILYEERYLTGGTMVVSTFLFG